MDERESGISITAERKYEQLRIYINGVLHLHIKLLDLIGFQSWIHGSNEHYIDYTFTTGKITSAYADRGNWISILRLLNENVTVA